MKIYEKQSSESRESGHTSIPKYYSLIVLQSLNSFRLVYIPAAVLTHSGHQFVWLTAILGVLLTFGGEWLARISKRRRFSQRQDLIAIVLSLLLLGLIPEEPLIGLILWMAIGLAKGQRRLQSPIQSGTANTWIGHFLGFSIGLSGLLGPGCWLMALLLIPLLFFDNLDASSPQKMT